MEEFVIANPNEVRRLVVSTPDRRLPPIRRKERDRI